MPRTRSNVHSNDLTLLRQQFESLSNTIPPNLATTIEFFQAKIIQMEEREATMLGILGNATSHREPLAQQLDYVQEMLKEITQADGELEGQICELQAQLCDSQRLIGALDRRVEEVSNEGQAGTQNLRININQKAQIWDFNVKSLGQQSEMNLANSKKDIQGWMNSCNYEVAKFKRTTSEMISKLFQEVEGIKAALAICKQDSRLSTQ
ncbi:MAG: hypothetical protein Q9165_007967 [Trypethelium subeluteriae]